MERTVRPENSPRDERILVLAVGRDSQLTCEILAANGLLCQPCSTGEELVREIVADAGSVVLAEEMLTEATVEALVQALRRQPPWSDLPLVVVTSDRPRVGWALHSLDVLGNVAVLPRPLSIDSLVSSLQSAQRARRRQYQVRDLLKERERMDQRKDEFMAMLAHELRNPLAPLRNAAAILKRLPPGASLDRVQGIIERQVDHQARLLDDLLDVSRITRGKITLHPVRLDLALLVRDTVEDCRSIMEDAGLSVHLTLPQTPVWVEGDPTRLAQVLTNLLVNASKFTDAGGEIRVGMVVEPEGRMVIVCVEDTGIGIERDRLLEVFEPFTQADRSLDRSRGGLGLGLALVKGLVELHGGSIWAYSPGPGQGSEFRFVLALADSPEAVEARHPAAPVARPQRVLIIEDNRDAAEMLRELLELSGYQVALAFTGPDGVAAAREFEPQVVLCDIGLPGMSGYEVAATLRRESAPEARLIALSGYGEDGDRRRAREASFDEHLLKPVAFEEVEVLLATPEERGGQRR
jgi:signal transduction histidine kinase/ActR/RegA family two-component response regulator